MSLGKKTAGLVLLVVALVALGFIMAQGIKSLDASREIIEVQTEPSIECIKYFIDIDKISYSEGLLSFEIENLVYSEDIEGITVASQGNTRSFEVMLFKGTTLPITADISVEDSFTIYADGCSIYSTRCTLDGKCEHAQN